jgi:hypothetical protein
MSNRTPIQIAEGGFPVQLTDGQMVVVEGERDGMVVVEGGQLFSPVNLGSSLINWQGPEILDAKALGDMATWEGQGGLPDMTAVTAGEVKVVAPGKNTLFLDSVNSEYYSLPDDAGYVTQTMSIGLACQVVSGAGTNKSLRVIQGIFGSDISWGLQFTVNSNPSLNAVSLLIATTPTDATIDNVAAHAVVFDEWASVIAVFDGTATGAARLRYWLDGVELTKNEFTDPPTTTRDSADPVTIGTWDGFGAGGFDHAHMRGLVIDGQAWNTSQIANVTSYLKASYT